MTGPRYRAKHLTGVLLAAAALSTWTAAPDSERMQPDVGKSRASESFGRLPLRFEANHGQTDGRVKFLSRGGGHSLFLTSTEAVLALEGGDGSSGAVRMKLVGSNPDARVVGVDELPGKSHYFVGDDPANWRTGVPSYRRVRYASVYPGVDLVYYGNQRQLEYDVIVAPGADPSAIALGFDGVDRIEVASDGDLVLQTPVGEIRQQRPHVYQEVGDDRTTIAGAYRLRGEAEVGFEVADYDRTLPLVIDPVLVYSTYLGGASADLGIGITVDASGNAYITGNTSSSNFPTTASVQPASGGQADIFVAKLDATGTVLMYSTYLGGGSGDGSRGIAVDSTGNAYVVGGTTSTNFPTANAFQAAFGGGGSDAFVAKVSADGAALLYSTYLGGSLHDNAHDIAVDSSGAAYVSGNTHSLDYPTANPLQPAHGGDIDMFVTKLEASGSALVYSTFLGGDQNDHGFAIAVDSLGNAYITGISFSGFPLVNPLQTGPPSFGGDAIVAKLNAAGSALIYSTYLGGSSQDIGMDIAVDAGGNAHVVGMTESNDFPAVHAYQPARGGGSDAFVTKLNPAGSAVVYSTYLGGSAGETNNFRDAGIAVDASGNVYVTSRTESIDFPTLNALQAALAGSSDAFVTKFSSGGSVLYSTYFGGTSVEDVSGVAADGSGNAYVIGYTFSSNLPTMQPLQASRAGAEDAFVAKISDPFLDVTIDIKPGSFPNSINLGAAGTVPVAIFSSPTFDARTLDPLTVTLAGAQVKLKGKGTPQYSIEHVDNDGRLDLIVHVSTEALQLTESDTEAVLNGMTSGGTRIRGTDSVRIVP